MARPPLVRSLVWPADVGRSGGALMISGALPPPQWCTMAGPLEFVSMATLDHQSPGNEFQRATRLFEALRLQGSAVGIVLACDGRRAAWSLGCALGVESDLVLRHLGKPRCEPVGPPSLAPAGGSLLLLSGLPGRDANRAALLDAGIPVALVTLAVPRRMADLVEALSSELQDVEHGDRNAAEASRAQLVSATHKRLCRSTRPMSSTVWVAVTWVMSPENDIESELAAAVSECMSGPRDDGIPLECWRAPWGTDALATHALPIGPLTDQALAPRFPSTVLTDEDLATLAGPPEKEIVGSARRRPPGQTRS